MLVIGLFLLLFNSVYTQTPEFLVHPVSINTTDGSTVKFTCTVNNNPTTLNFLVNNTAASLSTIEKKGFAQISTEPLGDGVQRRTLHVTASVADNSNSLIRCQAVGNSMIVDSDNATLLVQGPLSSVIDLSHSLDSSTFNISWSPPFTLLGTDITGYNISVASNETNCSSNAVSADFFTSDSFFTFSLTDVTASLYSEFTITVSGYNGLNGDSDSITVFVAVAMTTITVVINEDLDLTVQLNLTEYCITDIVSPVTMNLVRGGMVVGTANVSAESVLNVFDVFNIEEDQKYAVEVSFSVLGNNNVISNVANFDTDGVRSLLYTDTSDDKVTLVCVFNIFSTDSGCTVRLASTGGQYMYEETFPMDGGVAEGSISGVATGVYTIRAFDEGSNVVAVELLDVSITGELSTTSIATSSSISTSRSVSIDTTSTTGTLITSTSEATPRSGGGTKNDPPVVIYIAVSVGVIIIVLAVMIVFLVSVIWYKKKKNHLSKDLSRGLSSDGQPPSPQYEPVEMKETNKPSVTVIPPKFTKRENKVEGVEEVFFNHPDDDTDDAKGGTRYPPPPDRRAPSPPEDDSHMPLSIPSRSHDNGMPSHHQSKDVSDLSV